MPREQGRVPEERDARVDRLGYRRAEADVERLGEVAARAAGHLHHRDRPGERHRPDVPEPERDEAGCQDGQRGTHRQHVWPKPRCGK